MKRRTVYHYPACDTCRSAVKWLRERGAELELVHLFDHPPSPQELASLIAKSGLDVKKFFNTSGEVYKAEKLKDRLPGLSESEMIELLASNGRLIKRPLVMDGERVTVGFKEETFAEVWS